MIVERQALTRPRVRLVAGIDLIEPWAVAFLAVAATTGGAILLGVRIGIAIVSR